MYFWRGHLGQAATGVVGCEGHPRLLDYESLEHGQLGLYHAGAQCRVLYNQRRAAL